MDESILRLIMQSQQSPLQSLVSSIPLMQYGKNADKYYQPAQQFMNAQIDTANPVYQRIYGQQKEQGQQNLAASIAELVRQNRKLSMMGRTPLFNNERGGEQLFRNITRGYQDVGNQAANDTRNILGTAAQNNMTIGALQQQNELANATAKGNMYGAGAGLLQNVGNYKSANPGSSTLGSLSNILGLAKLFG